MKVILLELNELTPSLMDRFIAGGHLPNFDLLRRTSRVFLTDAGNPSRLEPWIQWVTVHSGMSPPEHGIEELGEGERFRGDRVWDVLSSAGLRSWICGSMNSGYRAGFRGAVLPDPWARIASPSAARGLEPYLKFVRTNVQEHTRDELPLDWRDYARFAAFMATHGLSAPTIASALKQLIKERRADHRWKRACLLDKLQLDLFRYHYRKHRPDFSTFFSNSTAHFQHLYWRNLEPERFRIRPSSDEQSRRGEAILHGYREMDRLLGKMMKLAGKHTALVFCTALSQQPHLLHEEIGGKVFYRPKDFDQFLSTLGVHDHLRVQPVMSEQFHIDFPGEPAAIRAERHLSALELSGERLLHIRREGPAIFAGCRIFREVGNESRLDGSVVRFYDLFYRADGMKSGRHHPEGMLWIRLPDHVGQTHEEKVPLEHVAPTLLSLFGVKAPAAMKGKPLDLLIRSRIRAA